MKKTIITAAITGGVHVPSQTPYLPITEDQIADEAIRAYQAGAAVAHIHARNPETGSPSSDLNLYRKIAEKIHESCGIIVCVTTGGGLTMTHEQRIAVVPELSPELASCNMGTINFALHPVSEKIRDFKFPWEKPYLEMTEDYAFSNTFKAIKFFVQTMNQFNTKPELEIYDVGMLNNTAFLIKQGILHKPVYLQFVMGILGGIPATIDNLIFLVNTAKHLIGDFEWSVCAAGKNQMVMGTVAMAMGGHVRVGLEDSVYIGKGILAKSNAEQVAKIVHIANELGFEPATPAEARLILGLKGHNAVDF